MAEPTTVIQAISSAIAEVSGMIKALINTAEVRELRKIKDAAIQYVFVDEKAGEYTNIDDKKQAQLKLHFRKRIFQ